MTLYKQKQATDQGAVVSKNNNLIHAIASNIT